MANRNEAKRSRKVAANLALSKSGAPVHQQMKKRKMQRRFSKVGRMFNTQKKQPGYFTSLSDESLQYPNLVIIEEELGRNDDSSSYCNDAHWKCANRGCNYHGGSNIPYIDKFGIPCAKQDSVQTRRVSLDVTSSKDDYDSCIKKIDDKHESISVTEEDGSTFEIDCLVATLDCAFASS